jgi:hypothetical protein
MCVTIADLDGFKISQRMGALYPASIVGGQASLAPKRRKEAWASSFRSA